MITLMRLNSRLLSQTLGYQKSELRNSAYHISRVLNRA